MKRKLYMLSLDTIDSYMKVRSVAYVTACGNSVYMTVGSPVDPVYNPKVASYSSPEEAEKRAQQHVDWLIKAKGFKLQFSKSL